MNTSTASAHLLVFQVLYLGGVVAISLAMAEDLEPWHTNGVDHWTTVRKELHISHLKEEILSCTYTDKILFECIQRSEMRKSVTGKLANEWHPVTALDANTYLQHAAVVGKAFELVSNAHAELLCARLHGATDHEAVAWLKHMQRAGDGGEGHGAHKNGHFLV